MSTLHSDDTLHSHDNFDRAMRDQYRDALQHVSPATRTRLAANRHAAMRGESMPARGWPLGAVFGGLAAVVFAITLGLNFNPGLNGEGGARPGAVVAVAVAASDLPLVTALDQDPEFYAWLTSSDAQLMAME